MDTNKIIKVILSKMLISDELQHFVTDNDEDLLTLNNMYFKNLINSLKKILRAAPLKFHQKLF